MFRRKVRRDLKTVKKRQVEREAGAVRSGRYSGGVFRVETMRRVHRAARRTLMSLSFAPRRWTQTIRREEDRATRGCKDIIRVTFHARWWWVRESQ